MRATRYSFAALWLLFMKRKRPNQCLNQRIPSQQQNAHLQLHRVKRRILQSVSISVDRKAAPEAPEGRNCIKMLWSVSSSRCSRSLSLLYRVGCRTNTTDLATCFAPVVLCRLPKTTRIILGETCISVGPSSFQDPPAQVRAPFPHEERGSMPIHHLQNALHRDHQPITYFSTIRIATPNSLWLREGLWSSLSHAPQVSQTLIGCILQGIEEVAFDEQCQHNFTTSASALRAPQSRDHSCS